MSAKIYNLRELAREKRKEWAARQDKDLEDKVFKVLTEGITDGLGGPVHVVFDDVNYGVIAIDAKDPDHDP